MNNFMQRHAVAIAVLVFMLLMLTLVFAPKVHGQADWDKSTLVASGQCLANGALRVTVTNNGQDMQGPVDYGAGGTCVRTPYCYIVNARWSIISFDMSLCKRLQRPIYYKMVCR